MASKHQSTKGPPSNACNVGIVSNSTKHLASTVVAPPTPQQNGPSSLSCGPQNGKRAGVVIVTDKIPKENGKKLFNDVRCISFEIFAIFVLLRNFKFDFYKLTSILD